MRVESAAKDSLTLAVQEKKFTPAPPCSLTLLVAVPKGKIIEGIIQKAVELGAHRIVPLLTERVVTQLDGEGAESQARKMADRSPSKPSSNAARRGCRRWRRRRPSRNFWRAGRKLNCRWSARCKPNAGIRANGFQEFQRQHGRLPHSAGVWIGPEGDFTLAELQTIEAAGAKPITLGALTLRVETAAIYCLSFLNYELICPPAV